MLILIPGDFYQESIAHSSKYLVKYKGGHSIWETSTGQMYSVSESKWRGLRVLIMVFSNSCFISNESGLMYVKCDVCVLK